jgi:hypothetical protein
LLPARATLSDAARDGPDLDPFSHVSRTSEHITWTLRAPGTASVSQVKLAAGTPLQRLLQGSARDVAEDEHRLVGQSGVDRGLAGL